MGAKNAQKCFFFVQNNMEFFISSLIKKSNLYDSGVLLVILKIDKNQVNNYLPYL